MGLFKSKTEKELDAIIQRLNMNMSNNYKDQKPFWQPGIELDYATGRNWLKK